MALCKINNFCIMAMNTFLQINTFKKIIIIVTHNIQYWWSISCGLYLIKIFESGYTDMNILDWTSSPITSQSHLAVKEKKNIPISPLTPSERQLAEQSLPQEGGWGWDQVYWDSHKWVHCFPYLKLIQPSNTEQSSTKLL